MAKLQQWQKIKAIVGSALERPPSAGGIIRWSVMTGTTSSGGKSPGRPGRACSSNPPRRSLKKRSRRRDTTLRRVSRHAAISSLDKPGAAYRGTPLLPLGTITSHWLSAFRFQMGQAASNPACVRWLFVRPCFCLVSLQRALDSAAALRVRTDFQAKKCSVGRSLFRRCTLEVGRRAESQGSTSKSYRSG